MIELLTYANTAAIAFILIAGGWVKVRDWIEAHTAAKEAEAAKASAEAAKAKALEEAAIQARIDAAVAAAVAPPVTDDTTVK